MLDAAAPAMFSSSSRHLVALASLTRAASSSDIASRVPAAPAKMSFPPGLATFGHRLSERHFYH
ncbi:hypothetical protein [Bradyrhizobium iriomotense]|uniref:hypothetical protein n=1 Tax=Bradyrhizobium iriomotense TaxID=441950 RepID=UPI0024E087DF|nr:hypothetical protein [Bradyrhizobium iriomotense]